MEPYCTQEKLSDIAYFSPDVYVESFEYIYAFYLIVWKVVGVSFVLAMVLYIMRPTFDKTVLLLPVMGVLLAA